MSEYKHILVAVDIQSNVKPILEKAIAMQRGNAVLSMVYVVEPVPYPENYFGSVPLDIQQSVIDHSKVELAAIGEQYGISLSCQHLLIGSPAQKIHHFTDSNNVDLIVVGSHGKHGLRLLLGSIANAVLHGANSDVLAVRVNADNDTKN